VVIPGLASQGWKLGDGRGEGKRQDQRRGEERGMERKES